MNKTKVRGIFFPLKTEAVRPPFVVTSSVPLLGFYGNDVTIPTVTFTVVSFECSPVTVVFVNDNAASQESGRQEQAESEENQGKFCFQFHGKNS
jgi:hypothetical protein